MRIPDLCHARISIVAVTERTPARSHSSSAFCSGSQPRSIKRAKKWLSYREHKLLGRSLSVDEARYVTEAARRIAAILLLGPELDRNYAAVKANGYIWPAKG